MSWISAPYAPQIEHRDGIPWYDAPIPRRWHQCRPQSRGIAANHYVERCACGALSYNDGAWIKRNQRRRKTH